MNYLIDSSIYIFQYYFSLPDNWHSKEGYSTSAVYGYTTFLLRFLNQEVLSQPPSNVALCFDESLGSCFRNDIYPDYKSSRELPDEELAFQLGACREVSGLLGLACFSSTTHEADDFIGSLSKKLRRGEQPIAILSRDKDLGQLVLRPQDFLWDYAKNKRSYGSDIFNKFGVQPKQMADYLALVGDSVDDIPGVPGVGPKTAQVLLEHHPSIETLFSVLKNDENILKALPLRGSAKLGEKLLHHREQVFMARQLSQIAEDIPLNIRVADLRWKTSDVLFEDLKVFCEAMGFPRLNSRIENLLY